MIKFLKVRDVKSPLRDEKDNAGIDFFVPEKSSELMDAILQFNPNIRFEGENDIIIPSQEDIKIPSGIKGRFDNDLMLMAANKSGISINKKLIYGAEVIDTSYEGEWNIHLINWSKYDQTIKFGGKVIQFIPVKISNEKHTTYEMQEMTEEEFFKDHESNRGAAGFGSTGT